MVNVSPRLRSVGEFGATSKFQRGSRLGFGTAPTSLNGGQPNFARCLAVSWAGTLYTVNHKKRDILFLTITLDNFNRFL